MDNMGASKICILNLQGFQCKAGRKRFTPKQSEDHSCFELFCLNQNAYNIAKISERHGKC